MNDRRFYSKTGGLIVYLCVIVVLLVAGCTPEVEEPPERPAPEEPREEMVEEEPMEEEPTEEEPTEEPTEEESEETAENGPVEIRFWYPGTGETDQGQLIAEQVSEFEQQYPDIKVELSFISEYETTLTTAVEAGDSPDVAFFWFQLLYRMYEFGSLQPIQEVSHIDDDFLKDGLESVRFGEDYAGLPFRRDSCALAYEYLGLFKASPFPGEAFRLIDFIANPEQQVYNFDVLNWFPTRASLYEELGLGCTVNEAIRPPPFTIPIAKDTVEERMASLNDVLEGGFVISDYATAVYENESVVAVAAPIWNSNWNFLSKEEAEAVLDSDGLVVGTLFINEIPEYPSGDYVVKCWLDYCKLITPNGDTIDYDLLIEEEYEYRVKVPRVSIEPGSQITCKTFLFWKRCTRVG